MRLLLLLALEFTCSEDPERTRLVGEVSSGAEGKEFVS